MKQPIRSTLKKTAAFLPLLFLAACSRHHVDPVSDTIAATKMDTAFIIKQETGSYCKAGEVWGARLRDQQGALYGTKQTDVEFASFLRTGESPSTNLHSEVGRFYFGVTDGLRAKFNDCFTTSYNRMDAEKVLGDHVSLAAYTMGAEVGDNLAKWPVEFFTANIPRSVGSNGKFLDFTKEINDHALLQLEYFNELLTVGSPADRQAFKVGFVCRYQKEMNVGLEKLHTMGVESEKRAPKESLAHPVVCDTRFPNSLVLKYKRTDEMKSQEIPGLIYANHTLFTKDADDLGFRVFTGEELYLRFYRRALYEAGSTLGKKLYHGLIKRSDGVEYLRNLALAVEKPADIRDFFGPGFEEAFSHQGDKYLSDMLCAVNHVACHGRGAPAKPKPQPDQSPAPGAAMQAPATQTLAHSSTQDESAGRRGDGTCYVQVGVYADEANLQIEKAKLEQLQVLAVLVGGVTLSESNTKATQLRVGPFASRSAADSELSRINRVFADSYATCL